MENLTPGSPADGNAWDRIRSLVRRRIAPGNFETWFSPTRLLSHESDEIRVRVPNGMFAEWMRTAYLGVIHEVLPSAGLGGCRIEFVTDEPLPMSPLVPAARGAEFGDGRARLNGRYTFGNFVVSSCNNFAHAAALAVSEQPASTYNPLFIYGGVGLGKTHLMQAIGNALINDARKLRVVYLTSEEFMNELISAIRFEETGRFRDRYRSVDVLLIDDVQFLAGKESTQEEFFHTFNALYDGQKQIVVTCDCPPRSIPALEERLRSRFEWGLIADISPPDLETKIAILNKMAASEGWELPSDVALFLASHVNSNIRELEGSLKTLVATASLQRRRPDLEIARQVIRSLAPQAEPQVTIETIVRVVANEFNLRVLDLKSRTNERRIAFPRQIAMYLAKKLAGQSYPAIADHLGNKHHTTALHAYRKIEKQLLEDASLQATLRRIEGKLR